MKAQARDILGDLLKEVALGERHKGKIKMEGTSKARSVSPDQTAGEGACLEGCFFPETQPPSAGTHRAAVTRLCHGPCRWQGRALTTPRSP